MTRPISIDIPHALGRAEARRRIDEGFGRLEQQLGAGALARVERRWEADRLQFRALALGQSVTGRIDVLDEVVKIELDLPPLLAAIAGRLKGRLKQETQLLLEKK
jgi:putative polyhydroxyalkanoate system protein